MAIPYNYSVIIPHKNIPDLLERCLASIPRRDDVQIIVVDDNSSPEIVDFNNFPGINDPYVEIYFSKVILFERIGSSGAGHARNIGLSHARGRWITFVDADDFFNACIGECMEEYCDDPHDIIFFRHNSVFSETLEPTNRSEYRNKYISKVLSGGNLDLLRYRSTVPWGKFIKREILENNHVFFEEVFFCEDMVFSAKSGFFAKKLKVSEEVAYCATERKNSLTDPTEKDAEKFARGMEECIKTIKFLLPSGKAHYIVGPASNWWKKLAGKDFRWGLWSFPRTAYYCGFGRGLKMLKHLFHISRKL